MGALITRRQEPIPLYKNPVMTSNDEKWQKLYERGKELEEMEVNLKMEGKNLGIIIDVDGVGGGNLVDSVEKDEDGEGCDGVLDNTIADGGEVQKISIVTSNSDLKKLKKSVSFGNDGVDSDENGGVVKVSEEEQVTISQKQNDNVEGDVGQLQEHSQNGMCENNDEHEQG